MADAYTPTTEEVRGDYANFQLPAGGGDLRAEYAEALAEVNRWLVAHDAEVRAAALAEQSGAIRALHAPVDIEPSDTICKECSFQLPNGRFFGKVVEWPCPTLDALDLPVPDTTGAES